MTAAVPVFERFHNLYIIRPSGCWEWTLAPLRSGYGRLTIGAGTVLAHRLSYQLNVGPIPDGMDILHSCDNRMCVNPEHLFPGTHRDNMDDMVRKGRQFSKLSISEQAEIVAAPSVTLALAQKHNISRNRLYSLRKERRGVSEGRAGGSRNGRALITEESVIRIFHERRSGRKVRDIACDLGLKTQVVSKVLRRVTWKHVEIS